MTIKYELYKLFVKRKIWLVILIAIVLRLILLLIQPNYAVNFLMEEHKNEVLVHMETLDGKLDNDKENYIKNEQENLNYLKNNTDYIIKFKAGEIAEEEFNERQRAGNNTQEMEQIMSVITGQYYRASQNPDKVYFLYFNGWSAFLGNENLDFIAIIFVILIVVPIICNEYNTDMYAVLRSTKNGFGRLFISKTISACITIMLMTIMFFIADVLFYQFKYGLPHRGYPIQSLPPFSESVYGIDIATLSVLTFLNKLFGLLFLAVILMFFSVLLKRALSATFVGISCTLLPCFMFSESSLQYILPTPLGFLLSCGFLKSEYPVSYGSTETITITQSQYIGTFCISFVIFIALIIAGTILFTRRKHIKGLIKLLKVKRSVSMFLILPIMLFTMTSCDNKTIISTEKSDNFIYNSSLNFGFADSENYVVDYWELEQPAYIFDKNTGESIRLISDPFYDPKRNQSDKGITTKVFAEGNKIYYLNKFSRYSHEIIELNINDFSRKVVYSDISADGLEMRNTLFGFGKYIPVEEVLENEVNDFFVYGSSIFMAKTNGIYRFDTEKNKLIQIYDKNVWGFSFVNNQLYYIDEVMDLYRYSLNENSAKKVDIGKIDRLFITQEFLFYKDFIDGFLYRTNHDGSERTLIFDFEVNEINFDDNFIYYLNAKDKNFLYQCDFNGENTQKIAVITDTNIFVFSNYEKLVFTDWDGAGISFKSIDKNSGEITDWKRKGQ